MNDIYKKKEHQSYGDIIPLAAGVVPLAATGIAFDETKRRDRDKDNTATTRGRRREGLYNDDKKDENEARSHSRGGGASSRGSSRPASSGSSRPGSAASRPSSAGRGLSAAFAPSSTSDRRNNCEKDRVLVVPPSSRGRGPSSSSGNLAGLFSFSLGVTSTTGEPPGTLHQLPQENTSSVLVEGSKLRAEGDDSPPLGIKRRRKLISANFEVDSDREDLTQLSNGLHGVSVGAGGHPMIRGGTVGRTPSSGKNNPGDRVSPQLDATSPRSSEQKHQRSTRPIKSTIVGGFAAPSKTQAQEALTLSSPSDLGGGPNLVVEDDTAVLPKESQRLVDRLTSNKHPSQQDQQHTAANVNDRGTTTSSTTPPPYLSYNAEPTQPTQHIHALRLGTLHGEKVLPPSAPGYGPFPGGPQQQEQSTVGGQRGFSPASKKFLAYSNYSGNNTAPASGGYSSVLLEGSAPPPQSRGRKRSPNKPPVPAGPLFHLHSPSQQVVGPRLASRLWASSGSISAGITHRTQNNKRTMMNGGREVGGGFLHKIAGRRGRASSQNKDHVVFQTSTHQSKHAANHVVLQGGEERRRDEDEQESELDYLEQQQKQYDEEYEQRLLRMNETASAGSASGQDDPSSGDHQASKNTTVHHVNVSVPSSGSALWQNRGWQHIESSIESVPLELSQQPAASDDEAPTRHLPGLLEESDEDGEGEGDGGMGGNGVINEKADTTNAKNAKSSSPRKKKSGAPTAFQSVDENTLKENLSELLLPRNISTEKTPLSRGLFSNRTTSAATLARQQHSRPSSSDGSRKQDINYSADQHSPSSSSNKRSSMMSNMRNNQTSSPGKSSQHLHTSPSYLKGQLPNLSGTGQRQQVGALQQQGYLGTSSDQSRPTSGVQANLNTTSNLILNYKKTRLSLETLPIFLEKVQLLYSFDTQFPSFQQLVIQADRGTQIRLVMEYMQHLKTKGILAPCFSIQVVKRRILDEASSTSTPALCHQRDESIKRDRHGIADDDGGPAAVGEDAEDDDRLLMIMEDDGDDEDVMNSVNLSTSFMLSTSSRPASAQRPPSARPKASLHLRETTKQPSSTKRERPHLQRPMSAITTPTGGRGETRNDTARYGEVVGKIQEEDSLKRTQGVLRLGQHDLHHLVPRGGRLHTSTTATRPASAPLTGGPLQNRQIVGLTNVDTEHVNMKNNTSRRSGDLLYGKMDHGRDEDDLAEETEVCYFLDESDFDRCVPLVRFFTARLKTLEGELDTLPSEAKRLADENADLMAKAQHLSARLDNVETRARDDVLREMTDVYVEDLSHVLIGGEQGKERLMHAVPNIVGGPVQPHFSGSREGNAALMSLRRDGDGNYAALCSRLDDGGERHHLPIGQQRGDQLRQNVLNFQDQQQKRTRTSSSSSNFDNFYGNHQLQAFIEKKNLRNDKANFSRWSQKTRSSNRTTCSASAHTGRWDILHDDQKHEMLGAYQRECFQLRAHIQNLREKHADFDRAQFDLLKGVLRTPASVGALDPAKSDVMRREAEQLVRQNINALYNNFEEQAAGRWDATKHAQEMLMQKSQTNLRKCVKEVHAITEQAIGCTMRDVASMNAKLLDDVRPPSAWLLSQYGLLMGSKTDELEHETTDTEQDHRTTATQETRTRSSRDLKKVLSKDFSLELQRAQAAAAETFFPLAGSSDKPANEQRHTVPPVVSAHQHRQEQFHRRTRPTYQDRSPLREVLQKSEVVASTSEEVNRMLQQVDDVPPTRTTSATFVLTKLPDNCDLQDDKDNQQDLQNDQDDIHREEREDLQIVPASSSNMQFVVGALVPARGGADERGEAGLEVVEAQVEGASMNLLDRQGVVRLVQNPTSAKLRAAAARLERHVDLAALGDDKENLPETQQDAVGTTSISRQDENVTSKNVHRKPLYSQIHPSTSGNRRGNKAGLATGWRFNDPRFALIRNCSIPTAKSGRFTPRSSRNAISETLQVLRKEASSSKRAPSSTKPRNYRQNRQDEETSSAPTGTTTTRETKDCNETVVRAVSGGGGDAIGRGEGDEMQKKSDTEDANYSGTTLMSSTTSSTSSRRNYKTTDTSASTVSGTRTSSTAGSGSSKKAKSGGRPSSGSASSGSCSSGSGRDSTSGSSCSSSGITQHNKSTQEMGNTDAEWRSSGHYTKIAASLQDVLSFVKETQDLKSTGENDAHVLLDNLEENNSCLYNTSASGGSASTTRPFSAGAFSSANLSDRVKGGKERGQAKSTDEEYANSEEVEPQCLFSSTSSRPTSAFSSRPGSAFTSSRPPSAFTASRPTTRCHDHSPRYSFTSMLWALMPYSSSSRRLNSRLNSAKHRRVHQDLPRSRDQPQAVQLLVVPRHLY
ncbi:unnamed protein product [Amoebophrya sp. A25]|nr:unnamed protein product [Amoebophrya sp. A25]|eukprot:GSA25T00015524001.1